MTSQKCQIFPGTLNRPLSAARRARSEGYDITYHSLRNLVAAGYISHVPNGSRIYIFYPNLVHFIQKGLTAEQSLDYQLSRTRN